MKEIWKDIPWYEWLYQASNTWYIYSCPKSWSWWHKGKILKASLDWQKKYLHINLTKNNIRKTINVHRLICITYNHNPENKPTVNHIDWDTLNNNKSNLEWNTYSENHLHAFRVLWRKNNMLWIKGRLHHWAKPINQYTLDWIFVKTWDCWADINRYYKAKHNHVSSCCNWKRENTLWFTWTFT